MAESLSLTIAVMKWASRRSSLKRNPPAYTSCRVINKLHFVWIQPYRMAMAVTTAVIPTPFDPHVPIFIDLTGEDCPNHRSDISSFHLGEILHPSAREGNEPHSCTRGHWFSGSAQEFVGNGILRGFPDLVNRDVFSVGRRDALGFQ